MPLFGLAPTLPHYTYIRLCNRIIPIRHGTLFTIYLGDFTTPAWWIAVAAFNAAPLGPPNEYSLAHQRRKPYRTLRLDGGAIVRQTMRCDIWAEDINPDYV